MARGLSEQQQKILAWANEQRAGTTQGGSWHLTYADALFALFGWRSGLQKRDYWQRRRHIPSNTMMIFPGRTKGPDTVIGTISRAEYQVAQASTARTLRRLVERGLLGRHPNYGYVLTEAGVRLADQWAAGLAEGGHQGPV
jgi:hypothetical protein